MKFLTPTAPERAPRLTGSEVYLVMEYMSVVAALVSRTTSAAYKHPETHPYLVRPEAVVSVAGRAVNEAFATSGRVQDLADRGGDRIAQTYEMMGLSGSQQTPTNVIAGQPSQSPLVPDSLEGYVDNAEVAAARQLVEASYAREATPVGGPQSV